MDKTLRIRRIIGVSMIAVIAIIHLFNIGNYLDGELHSLYYSYFADIIIPFGVYFLLCIAEFNIPVLSKWYIKAILILSITTSAELLQYFDIYAFGITFDYFDLLMYIIGVGFAILIEKFIFKRYVSNWNANKNE